MRTVKAIRPPVILPIFLAALLLAAFASCAANKEIREAKKSLDSAKTAHADYLSPYEYTSAEVYLREAKNQARRTDFDRAIRYAHKAIEMAAKATSIAMSKTGILTAGAKDISSHEKAVPPAAPLPQTQSSPSPAADAENPAP